MTQVSLKKSSIKSSDPLTSFFSERWMGSYGRTVQEIYETFNFFGGQTVRFQTKKQQKITGNFSSRYCCQMNCVYLDRFVNVQLFFCLTVFRNSIRCASTWVFIFGESSSTSYNLMGKKIFLHFVKVRLYTDYWTFALDT